ncbi:MAG: hypothetical protein GXP62_15765 [Oligoflexia bacterium]|nr:hypothetical protein [Oligoflexia bacterium]
MNARMPHLVLAAPLASLLATACGGTLEPEVAPLASPDEIGATWAAVQPEGLLDLVDATSDAVPQGLACPTFERADGIDTWTGGCSLLDGTVIEGSLRRYEGLDGSWVAGQRFAVIRDDHLELYLDGSVELWDQGELLQLEASATICGAQVDCADGLVSLDLRYTLRFGEQAPDIADATVRGVVALDGAEPAAVEGAWRLDRQVCAKEPVDGIFAVLLDQRQTLELDGDTACDGCARWTIQGMDAPTWCPSPR